MRLAYLDPHAVPDDVPEALQILQTVDAFGSIGIETILVTPEPRVALPPHEILTHDLSPLVTVRHLPDFRRRWWFPINSNRPFYRAAARALAQLSVDAVIVRNLKMAEYLLRHQTVVPLIFETHELFAQTYREEHAPLSARHHRRLAGLEARERFVYRAAHGLVALTPLLIEDIRNAYVIDTPTTVAPDGVDLRAADKHSAELPPNQPPVLLYLGSLHPWKGVDIAIRAMALLKYPARLVVVGGNDRRIRELRTLAQELGVGNHVQFPGPCRPAERFATIRAADICLLPLASTSIGSRYTSPLKLFEYMAMGKPVVASDLPSLRAVLEPDRHALLAASGDPSSFAAAIDRLLEDPTLRKRLGAAGHERARAFSWENRAAHIRQFVSELLVTAPHRNS